MAKVDIWSLHMTLTLNLVYSIKSIIMTMIKVTMTMNAEDGETDNKKTCLPIFE